MTERGTSGGMENTSPCTCSIVWTEGETIDLQGMEDWLSTMEVTRPRLGEGVRQRWLKTLASILDQLNDNLSGRR